MMPSMQMFELSLIDKIELLTREPLLIVRLLILKPSLSHYETGKKETLSRSYLCLAHSTWSRRWWSWLPQDGTPFLIMLARTCHMKTSPNTPPYRNMGEPFLASSSWVHWTILTLFFAHWLDQHITSSFFSIKMMSWITPWS
jgi:hypothetical protein